MLMTGFLQSRIWKLLCSLKVTIVLASSATLLSMGGSLLIPFNPQVFSELDSVSLGLWLEHAFGTAPGLTWWIPVAGLLVILLAINGLCCFVDWLFCFRARWRKTGEYLIHLGFVLLIGAFLWGSQTGFRTKAGVLVGQGLALKELGVVLRLEAFEPIVNRQGRPIDMRNSLALYRGDELLVRATARFNHPLTWRGLVVIPSSYGQTTRGGRRLPYSVLTINYDPAAPIAFAGGMAMGGGVLLTLISFYRKRLRGDHPDIV